MPETLFSYSDDSQSPLARGAIRLIERATGQPELHRIYLENQRNPVPGETFFQAAIRRLDLDVVYDATKLDAVPKSGPLVVVANHPYGVLDGLVLCWLIEKVRSDFLVLTNSVLLRAPEARPYLLAVDFAETREAFETNIGSRQTARRHLTNGGCLVVFPAGAVSTAPDRLGRRPAVDAQWHPFAAQLIQRAKAPVVPFYFAGQNSRLFQIASHISMVLRLSLIFKEVRDRMHTKLPVAVGDLIPYEDLAGFGERRSLVEELRRRTYALGKRVLGEERMIGVA
jgi:putative hemolysin